MDWKLVVIGVLVATAVLLSGLVAGGLRQDAYAQGGVYATYLAVTANVTQDMVNFVVLDSASRRVLFYKVNITSFALEPSGGIDLTKDFKRTTY
jgi:hypothetical protein